jgi:hypothetical protein
MPWREIWMCARKFLFRDTAGDFVRPAIREWGERARCLIDVRPFRVYVCGIERFVTDVAGSRLVLPEENKEDICGAVRANARRMSGVTRPASGEAHDSFKG